MWMDIGWGLYFQVVGTHKRYMSSLKFFLPLVVGALKPSITFVLLPSPPLAPLAPSHSLPPQRWWGPQNIVWHTPTLHWPLGMRGEQGAVSWEEPLAQQRWWASQNWPPQVVGMPQHTPRSPLWPTSAQSIVSEGSKLGARGGTLGSREVVGIPKIGPTGGRDPKTYHLMSYLLPLLGPLGVRGASLGPIEVVGTPKLAPTGSGFPKHPLRSPLPPTFIGPLGLRGASWEWGEGPLVQEKWWGTPEIGPTGGEDPKIYHLMSITHYLLLVHSEWGEQALAHQRLLAPQNLPPQVVGSPKHTPRSPLPPTSLAPSCSPCSLSLPGTFLGPQEAFGSLGSSVRLGGITPSQSPSPPEPSWGLRKPCEPLEAFGSLGSSVRLGGLAPPTPWASLDSWGLRKPWVFSQTQGPCSPLTTEPPWAPGASGSLRQTWIFSQTRGPCSLSPPHSPWAFLGPWDLPGPQEAFGALGQPQEPWEPRKLSEPQGARGERATWWNFHYLIFY